MCWNTARRRRSDCSVGRSASMSSFTSVATGPLAPHAGRADAAAACATDRAAFVASLPSFTCVQARGASCPPMSRALESASEADPSAPTAPSTSRDASPVDLSRSSAARRPAPATATLPSARSREASPEILKAPLQAGKTTVFPRATPSRSLPAGWCASARLPLSCPLPTGTRRLSRRDRATAAATLTPRAATRVHLTQPGWNLAGAITPGYVRRRSWKFSPVNV